jgi:hypothetical protein
MELGAHCVMVVTCHSANWKTYQQRGSCRNGLWKYTQRSILPIPDSDGLVIGAGDNPRKLMVEENCADIIQMTVQGKQASSSLV